MNRQIPIFKTNGNYLGFVNNDFLFSRDGVYLGWLEGNFVWDKSGNFRGSLMDLSAHHYILSNKFAVPPIPKTPIIAPITPPLPPPPSNIAAAPAPFGLLDAFN